MIIGTFKLDSFLNIGMTLLDFKIQKKTPREKESQNISDNWSEELSLSNFKIFVESKLGQTAFRRLRSEIIIWISVLSNSFMKKRIMSISEIFF